MRRLVWMAPLAGLALVSTSLMTEHADAPEGARGQAPDQRMPASASQAASSPDTGESGRDPWQRIPSAERGAVSPLPVWQIRDLDFPGSVLPSSGLPSLAISHTQTVSESNAGAAVPDAEPAHGVAVEQLAAKEPKLSKVSTTSNSSPWEVVGQSAQGKPIHLRRFGTTGEVTLIVTGLAGDDRIAVKWIDHLSQELADAPESVGDRQILVLRDVNPDGLTVKKVANSRGVVLNQNFPTTDFQPSEAAGTGPASEAETRAVLEVLYRYKPRRVIHVESAGRSEVAANAAAKMIADGLQRQRRVEVESLAETQKPGSLEAFANQVLKLEVMTLRLATGDDWRSAAVEHYPTLLAATGPAVGSTADEQTAEVQSPFSMESDDLAAADPDAAMGGPGVKGPEITRLDRRGYEELPRPPASRQ